ncbi:MAG: hypothetical protein OES38_02930 [Gammaproteobacteria bacterium]|nr:hypothetical protein [Gammaproteobacteria bacterium]
MSSSNAAWLNWCNAGLAVLSLAFVVGNIVLHRTNLDLQEQLAERQQFINESIRLSNFNGQLVQALATLSAQTGDAAIRDLLAGHGINFTVNQPAESEEGVVDE